MFAVAVMFAVPLRGSAISRVGGDLEGNGLRATVQLTVMLTVLLTVTFDDDFDGSIALTVLLR